MLFRSINLTLHVTGQRDDGYHLLDSLVMFADIGDVVTVSDAAGLTLAVSGPEAESVPAGGDNSVLQATRFIGQDGLALGLVKNLPTAAGIGGGTADAAAALRAVSEFRGITVPDNVLPLGADVPVCLRARATRMSGIGEVLADVPKLPKVWAVLVNPRMAVSTPAVFAALEKRDNAEMPAVIPAFGTACDMADWLGKQRNDLEAAAVKVQPVVADVLAQLKAVRGQMLVRMSGSGATCFALFETAELAKVAADDVAAARPDWWVQSTCLS